MYFFSQYYLNIYLFVVTLFSLICVSQYISKDTKWSGTSSQIYVLVICLIFFIGLRPVGWGYFGDSAMTWHLYEVIYKNTPFVMELNTENLIYDNLLAFFASLDLGLSYFFLVCATIYFGAAYIGIKRLFPQHCTAAYLVFLAAFSTFSYASNGVKSGAAASIFIMAISYSGRWWICFPLMLISYGFHHSMHVPMAAYVITLFFKNPKFYFYGWVICAFMTAIHITDFTNLFAGMTDSVGVRYLTGMKHDDILYDRGGFRADMIAYSAVPVLVGYIAVFKKKIYSPMYNTLLCLYMTTNGIWMLCIYATFTNRIAYLSWFLYPVILIYPFLLPQWGKMRFRTLAQVMLAHLCFTLLMDVI